MFDGLTGRTDGPKVTVSVRVNGVVTSDWTAVERSTVSLECSTTVANPPVIAEATWWLRNGMPVQDARRALMMRRLDRTQAGRYTCSATNTLAPSGEPPRNVTGTATVQLRVMCKCRRTLYDNNSSKLITTLRRLLFDARHVDLQCYSFRYLFIYLL